MRQRILLDKGIVLSTYDKCDRSLNATGKALNVSSKTIKKYFKEWNIEYDMPPRYTCDETAFDQLNDQSMYWLGFLAADGNVQKHKYSYTLKLELASKDEQHLLKFKDFMKSNTILYNYENRNNCDNTKFKKDVYYSSQIRITSKYVFDKLAIFNIIPNKTHTYIVPQQLTNHPLLPHFLRGFIDGDGCYTYRYNNKSPTITGIRISLIGNPLVVNQIFKIIKDKCQVNTGYCHNKSINTAQFEFEAKDDVTKIVNYLYNDATIYLDRKALIALEAPKFVNMTKVLTIEQAEKIREEYKTIKSSRKLAKKYNVSKPTILHILRGETYLK